MPDRKDRRIDALTIERPNAIQVPDQFLQNENEHLFQT